MSLDWNKLSPEERDARITTLLLGELPPNEADELRAIIATDAELARACVRRGKTISLLREAAAAQGSAEVPVGAEVAAPARLSNERREKLLQSFKSAAPAPAERARWRLQMPQWFLPMSAAAIFIGLLIIVAVTTISPGEKGSLLSLSRGGSSERRYYAGAVAASKLAPEDHERFALELEKERSVLARGITAPPRVTMSGLSAATDIPKSDFSDKIESKSPEPAKSSPRFAIVLPGAENKERGRELQLAQTVKNISDFDSDGTRSSGIDRMSDNLAANSDFFFEGGATARGSEVAAVNGRETKSYITGRFRSPESVSELSDVQRRGEERAKLAEPTLTPATIPDLEAKVSESVVVDGLKSVDTKLDGYTTVRLKMTTPPKVANDSAWIKDGVAAGDSTTALPANTPLTLHFSESTNAFVSFSGSFGTTLQDSAAWQSRVENPAPLPATAPVFNSGNAMVASGGARLSAGGASEGRTQFGNRLNNAVSRLEGAQGQFKSEAVPERTLNESLARADDRFGLQPSDPIALGFTPAPKQVESLGAQDAPRPEAVLSDGIVSYYNGAELPARPAVNQQTQGLGVNSPAEPAGSLPAILSADDALRRAQDSEWSFRGFGTGGGAIGGAASGLAGGGGFGNRSDGSTVEFGRNRLYAGVSTAPSSDSIRNLNRNGIVDSIGKDGEAGNLGRQKTQGHYFSGATNFVALGEVEAFSFGESQSGSGGGGRSGRGGGGFGRAGAGRPEQNLGVIQAGVKVDRAARPEAPAASKPQTQRDVGGLVVGVDSAGLAVPANAEKEAEPLTKQIAAIEDSKKLGQVAQRAEKDNQLAEVAGELEEKRKAPSVENLKTNASKPSAPPPIPQPEVLSRENAFSTFSLNVSDVSFKLAAASLEKGAMPDAANIRSEEFINAFDYRDPMPLPGTPLVFAWERARYPFAHNRDVVRFSVKTAAQGREAGKPLNIVVLLDNSGSMERADRVRIIHESLRTLAAQLKPQDKISVVTFARTASLRVDGVSGTNAIDVADKVGVLTPEGGTNLEDALDLAYRTALRHYEAGAVNRIVLLTDGAANLGNVEPKALKAKVENYRKQGIALDCFGIGWEGFNDDLLEQLSRNGDGRYGFVNTPEEAASEFVGQLAGALRVAASDVKMQVEFNPKRVTAWRQIGYAKHQLTKEQFRDNKVDAAEIGAAESGNALYVIESNPNGEGPVATVRARFRVPQTTDYREHEWVVPFGSAVELQQAAPSLRLATIASAFSEWLAASPYAGEVATDRLLQVLSGVPETYGADPRPKRLEWMIRQAKSISGK